ncbi:MAG: amidohydrolase [Pirellulales bacterium]|jgi:hippurate hydrolase
MHRHFWFVFLAIIVFSQTVKAQEPKEWVKENLNNLVELYVHFHKTPELSFHEKETAARLASELKSVGAEVTENVGGFGIVGLMKNGDGPTVMVRTDLDALPIIEATDVPYASKVTTVDADSNTVGVMHACGHDIHMTTLAGVAQFLAANKDKWQGTVMFIGQPAEERGMGALAMLDDGLFEKFPKPDYALALHCNSVTPSGSVSVRPGYAMANVDSVDIEVFGRGGHGAYPHTTIDPIVQAAKLVVDLQTLVSREVKPIEAGVVTVGSIHAGTKHNIISDSCKLQLTVRSYSEEVRQLLLNGIKRKAKAAAMSAGAKEPKIEISEGTPSLSNDADLTAKMKEVFEGAIGAENVLDAEPVMGGEDFSQYGRAGVPSLMYFLGVVEPRKLEYYETNEISPPSLHSAEFAPHVEPSLTTGIVTMSSGVLELLKKP